MVGIQRKLDNQVSHDFRCVERRSTAFFAAKGMRDRNFRITTIAMGWIIQNFELVTIP